MSWFRGRTILSAVIVTALVGLALWVRYYYSKTRTPTPSEAAGRIDHLPGKMRRALTPTGQHRPVPKPKKGDWLAEHPEPGQTFDAFVKAKYNRPTPDRQTLVIVPVGPFRPGDSPSLAALKEYTEAFFQLPVELRPAVDPKHHKFTTRINRGSRKPQILVRDLMALLRKRMLPTTYAAAAVTMTDIYPSDDWNFVFGQASLRNRVGTYSFARYDPAFSGGKRGPGFPELLLRRSARVLNHETGHMFGLWHCIYYSCTMNGSNHLAEDDSIPLHLCPVCLRKLFHAVRFDVEKRYEDLQRFYRKVGLNDEYRWVKKRLAFIRGAKRKAR
jgi:archaemetzincin